MLLRLKEMKAALAAAQTQGVSMRRRLKMCIRDRSKCRTNRRSRGCLACRNLQFNITCNFLCHLGTS